MNKKIIVATIFIILLIIGGSYLYIKQSNNPFPGMNKAVGIVGHGETFLPNPGAYGSFSFVTFSDSKDEKRSVNILEPKNSDLKEGEAVIVFYDPSNVTKVIIYNSQNLLIYDTINK